VVKRRRIENTNFVIKRLRCFLKVRRGEKVKIKLMPNVYIVLVCSLKITKVINGIDAKNV
jgi:hypothetical protein